MKICFHRVEALRQEHAEIPDGVKSFTASVPVPYPSKRKRKSITDGSPAITRRSKPTYCQLASTSSLIADLFLHWFPSNSTFKCATELFFFKSFLCILDFIATVGLAIRRHSRAIRTQLMQRNVDLASSLERMSKRLVLSLFILIVCVLMNKYVCVILALLNTVNQVIKTVRKLINQM